MIVVIATIIGAVILISSFITAMRGTASNHAHTPVTSPQDNPDYQRMRNIANRHSDCTAEVFMLTIKGRKAVNEVEFMSPGDVIELKLDRSGDIIAFTLDNIRLGSPIIPFDSNFRRVIGEKLYFDAYMGGRDDGFMGDSALITIVVFYRLPGVPPTTLEIK